MVPSYVTISPLWDISTAKYSNVRIEIGLCPGAAVTESERCSQLHVFILQALLTLAETLSIFVQLGEGEGERELLTVSILIQLTDAFIHNDASI